MGTAGKSGIDRPGAPPIWALCRLLRRSAAHSGARLRSRTSGSRPHRVAITTVITCAHGLRRVRQQNPKFFRLLAKNQSREWFQAHKAEFEEGWLSPMKDLLGEVRHAIDKGFPHCDLDDPKIFRIYRDVRFSKDKAPYKTHVGGLIPVKRSGRTTEVPIALYFQVGSPAPSPRPGTT